MSNCFICKKKLCGKKIYCYYCGHKVNMTPVLITQPEKKSIHSFLKNDRFFIKDLYGLKKYGTVLYDKHNDDPSKYKKHTYKVNWDDDIFKSDYTIHVYKVNMTPVL